MQESGTYSIGPNKHAVCSGTKVKVTPGHCTVWEIQYRKVQTSVAPLAWVPWVPGNPSIFEQWVSVTTNLGKKGLNSTLFSV